MCKHYTLTLCHTQIMRVFWHTTKTHIEIKKWSLLYITVSVNDTSPLLKASWEFEEVAYTLLPHVLTLPQHNLMLFFVHCSALVLFINPINVYFCWRTDNEGNCRTTSKQCEVLDFPWTHFWMEWEKKKNCKRQYDCSFSCLSVSSFSLTDKMCFKDTKGSDELDD